MFNTLTINNAVTISGATFDVLGGTGDEKIDNYGTLTTPGRIDLGIGINAFNNRAGATFNSGVAVALGAGNTLANAGDLSPGGANAVQVTTLTGNFQNFIEVVDEDGNTVKKKGTFTVTTGPNDSSDLLIVTGVALLGGTVRVVGAYEGTYTILDAERIPTTDEEFDDVEVVNDSLFMTFELENGDSNNDNFDDTVTLNVTRNTLSFLEATGVTGTPNQRAVANILDSLDPTDPDN